MKINFDIGWRAKSVIRERENHEGSYCWLFRGCTLSSMFFLGIEVSSKYIIYANIAIATYMLFGIINSIRKVKRTETDIIN